MAEDITPDDSASSAGPTPWFLYLIECVGGSVYTGIAVDVAARYATHVKGKGARYTRANSPVRLLASLNTRIAWRIQGRIPVEETESR